MIFICLNTAWWKYGSIILTGLRGSIEVTPKLTILMDSCSHFACAIRTSLGVNRKHFSFWRKAIQSVCLPKAQLWEGVFIMQSCSLVKKDIEIIAGSHFLFFFCQTTFLDDGGREEQHDWAFAMYIFGRVEWRNNCWMQPMAGDSEKKKIQKSVHHSSTESKRTRVQEKKAHLEN